MNSLKVFNILIKFKENSEMEHMIDTCISRPRIC